MSEKWNKELIWIEQGYKTFAYEGPQGLRIERLARSAGRNKSSFYHFFADLEIFTQNLLDHHMERAKEMVQKESEAKTENELVQIIVDHKTDLLFNRQLRFHRENPEFRTCYEKIDGFSIPGLLPVWKEIIGLKEDNYLAKLVLTLALENFYLQITDETINETWIKGYFKKVREMVKLFKKTNSIPIVDGSV